MGYEYTASGSLEFKGDRQAAYEAAIKYLSGRPQYKDVLWSIKDMDDLFRFYGLFLDEDEIRTEGWKKYDSDLCDVLNVMAPYIEYGRIYCEGEDGNRWCLDIRKGKCEEHNIVEIFPMTGEKENWDKLKTVSLDFEPTEDGRLSLYVARDGDSGYEIKGTSIADTLAKLNDYLIYQITNEENDTPKDDKADQSVIEELLKVAKENGYDKDDLISEAETVEDIAEHLRFPLFGFAPELLRKAAEMLSEKYYGFIQSRYGADHLFIFSEEQLKGVDGDLPQKKGETTEIDLFPYGGSNSAPSQVWLLETEEDIKGFLTRPAYGPDYEDAPLIALAEYYHAIDTDMGCAKEWLDKLGLDKEEVEKEAMEDVNDQIKYVCDRLFITTKNFYDGRYRNVRLSEVEGLASKKN